MTKITPPGSNYEYPVFEPAPVKCGGGKNETGTPKCGGIKPPVDTSQAAEQVREGTATPTVSSLFNDEPGFNSPKELMDHIGTIKTPLPGRLEIFKNMIKDESAYDDKFLNKLLSHLDKEINNANTPEDKHYFQSFLKMTEKEVGRRIFMMGEPGDYPLPKKDGTAYA